MLSNPSAQEPSWLLLLPLNGSLPPKPSLSDLLAVVHCAISQGQWLHTDSSPRSSS